MAKSRDPREARTPDGVELKRHVAGWNLAKHYARQGGPDSRDCRQDIDRNDLGSSRAAQAMRVENYGR